MQSAITREGVQPARPGAGPRSAVPRALPPGLGTGLQRRANGGAHARRIEGHRGALARSAAAPGVGGEGPVQMALPGATRFEWALWARGGGKASSDRNLAAVSNALARYHRERSAFRSDQAFSDHRAEALDDAQRGVHRYLTALGGLETESLPRDYMLDLLDELQAAHVEHTDYVHRNDLDLYGGGPLGKRARKDLRRTWNQLRNGTGTIRLPGGEANAADNRATRAAFARLLARAEGRRLLFALLDRTDGDFPIDVSYTNRLSAEEQDRRETNRRDFKLARGRYQQLRASGASEEEVAEAHEAMMVFLDESRGDFRNPAADEPAAASKAPVGASLRILRGLSDSENLSHSGMKRGLIATPAHIVLGHELVHALHYRRRQDDPGNPDDYAAGTGREHWGNAEEERTIRSGRGPTENRLRREHDLPAREGHTGVARRTLGTATARIARSGARLAGQLALVAAISAARFPLGEEAG